MLSSPFQLLCPVSSNVHRQDTCPGAARGVRVRPQRLQIRSLRYQSMAPGIPLLHVEHQRLRFESVSMLHVACLTLHLSRCALATEFAPTQELRERTARIWDWAIGSPPPSRSSHISRTNAVWRH